MKQARLFVVVALVSLTVFGAVNLQAAVDFAQCRAERQAADQTCRATCGDTLDCFHRCTQVGLAVERSCIASQQGYD